MLIPFPIGFFVGALVSDIILAIPSAPVEREPEDRDVAFASSLVEDGSELRLYYSIADRAMYRAVLRRL